MPRAGSNYNLGTSRGPDKIGSQAGPGRRAVSCTWLLSHRSTLRPCVFAFWHRASVYVQLPAFLRGDECSTCVCLRLREQCLCSEITSVARAAHVLLLRFVAGNMGVNTLVSKKTQLYDPPQKVDLCVLSSFSCRIYAETHGRKVQPVAGNDILRRSLRPLWRHPQRKMRWRCEFWRDKRA